MRRPSLFLCFLLSTSNTFLFSQDTTTAKSPAKKPSSAVVDTSQQAATQPAGAGKEPEKDDALKTVLAVLAGVVGLGGFLFGLYQYRMRKYAERQGQEKFEEQKRLQQRFTAEEFHRHALQEELPKSFRNPWELSANYILLPGAKEKIIFASTKKYAPDEPLYFAKYPVTNKLYNRFLAYLAGNSRGENLPREQFAQSLLAKAATIEGFADFLGKNPEAWAEKLDSYHDKRFNGDDQPAVRVSWFAATAYCHWLTELHQNSNKSKSQNQTYIFRLPIEEEWEWAASGGKRKYPWGDKKPDETLANYSETVGHTTPVGAYPAGATPEGLLDMAGNVWEWMENRVREDKNWRGLRGGAWNYIAEFSACACRANAIPVGRVSHFGFRVVYGQSRF